MLPTSPGLCFVFQIQLISGEMKWVEKNPDENRLMFHSFIQQRATENLNMAVERVLKLYNLSNKILLSDILLLTSVFSMMAHLFELKLFT